MSQAEKMLLRIGRFLLVFSLGPWMWSLLPVLAWYVKNIPDRSKNVPFSRWLRDNNLQGNDGNYIFYSWLSNFLLGWWKVAVLGAGSIILLLVLAIASAALLIPATKVLIDSPFKIVVIFYLVSAVSFGYIGFSSAKS